jgi:hypothetical protein
VPGTLPSRRGADRAFWFTVSERHDGEGVREAYSRRRSIIKQSVSSIARRRRSRRPVANRGSEAHENYTLTGHDGRTTLDVDLDTTDEYRQVFEGAFPRALQRVKTLAEAA